MTPPRTLPARPQSRAVLPGGPRRPAPAPDRPRHLQVVPGRPAPGRRPPLLFVALAVGGTVAALFALVTLNVLLGQSGLVQARLEERVREQRLEVERLEIGAARLRAPSRIYDRALRLGLRPADDVVVLVRPAPSPERGGR